MGLILALVVSLADEETLVSGVVRTDLKVRPKKLQAIENDPKCACLHETTPKADNLVVGSDGGVKWAIVRVTKGLEGKTFAPPAEPVKLDQKGCVYAPHVVAAMTGQPVEFRNSDPMLHNIHGLPFDNREFNFAQQGGAADVRKFPKPEIFKVKCDVHPWMGAWIGVFEHPYFAVTDDGGRFAIKNLPAGKYTLEVWHEGLKGPAVEITVEGKETKVPPITLVEK